MTRSALVSPRRILSITVASLIGEYPGLEFWEEHLLEFDCLVLGVHPVRVYATDDGETVLLEIQRLGS